MTAPDPVLSPEDLLARARAALRSEPRIKAHQAQIMLDVAGDTLTVEGEVASVAAKKLALERLAALPGISGIIDRLHVRPATRMSDGEVRDHVRDALLEEPALAEITLLEDRAGDLRTIRVPPGGARGEVRLSVEDGVVTLSGAVPGLGLKRLAGIAAWWVPGSRDVINGIAVTATEGDSDGEMTDAVRIVLDKDPFVDAAQVRVTCKDRVVTLDGVLPSEATRAMAEDDAWCVFGVDEVVNLIEVRA